MRSALERLAARRAALVRRSSDQREALAAAAAELRPLAVLPDLARTAVRAWATYALVRKLLRP